MDTEKCRFANAYSKVCEHCAEYSRIKSALPTNSLFAKGGVSLLARLSELVQRRLSEESPLLLGGLHVTHSRGAGKYPRVPWVGITRRGRKVSTGHSVTICFGRTGNGAVIGLMLPSNAISSRVDICLRSPIIDGIDVDGDSSATKYNDKFINPLELPSVIDEDGESIVVEHLIRSIALLRDC